MSKIHTIIVSGLVVALLPYLGFPQSFRNFLFVFLGLFVSFLAYRILREKAKFYSESLFDMRGPSETNQSEGNLDIKNHGQLDS